MRKYWSSMRFWVTQFRDGLILWLMMNWQLDFYIWSVQWLLKPIDKKEDSINPISLSPGKVCFMGLSKWLEKIGDENHLKKYASGCLLDRFCHTSCCPSSFFITRHLKLVRGGRDWGTILPMLGQTRPKWIKDDNNRRTKWITIVYGLYRPTYIPTITNPWW